MKQHYRVTGLMSGSSMDGVDLACCDFWREGREWKYRILAAETIPYSRQQKAKLEMACNWEPGQIRELDMELGHYYAALLRDFHREHQLAPDYISSHGHTILHDPDRRITLQAGNGRIMATMTGIPVINDFRREDVAQGGQGAPLVPLGDQLLFPAFGGCLNLGGFANISFDNHKGVRLAYDLCPANMALNWIAEKEGKAFDMNGDMARRGRMDPGLLNRLNMLEYYRASPPKSLGREWFLEQFLPLVSMSELQPGDLMATVLEHIVVQLADGIKAPGLKSVLITGGGALNQTLIERLKLYTTASLVIPDTRLIHYKEALIFGLLGILKIRGEINCLASVTGGRADISAGMIHKP